MSLEREGGVMQGEEESRRDQVILKMYFLCPAIILDMY